MVRLETTVAPFRRGAANTLYYAHLGYDIDKVIGGCCQAPSTQPAFILQTVQVTSVGCSSAPSLGLLLMESFATGHQWLEFVQGGTASESAYSGLCDRDDVMCWSVRGKNAATEH